MDSYSKKEISEWNTKDLCNWLTDNKYPGISELCQNNSISGYDLFFINDDILKNEFGLRSFHERKVTLKLINKLIYEHLKLNIINFNGDNVILTLDNNPNTSLGELSEYIGGMFNIDPKDILYKDSSKTEVLSPSLKIINLLILYPRLYKTLNIFNMKDYHQVSENENLESKNNFDYQNNNSIGEVDVPATESESDYQKININNKKMNFDYGVNKKTKMKNEIISKENYDINEDKRIIYNDDHKNNMKNNKIVNNDDYDIKNKKYKNEKTNYLGNIDDNLPDENSEENEENNWKFVNNDLKYNNKINYRENNIIQEYSSVGNRKNMNFNCENYMNNKSYKILDNRDNNNYYNNNDLN